MPPEKFRRQRQTRQLRRVAGGFTALAALALSACDRPAAQAGLRQKSDAKTANALLIVDSVLPTSEALRRFQAELSPVSRLEYSARNRNELIGRFIDAIEKSDTATLEWLLISKAEYAFLYFPSSVYSRKPYELPPDIAWLLSEENSRKGLTRLIRRLGGQSLGFGGYDCGAAATEGENEFWRSCHVTYVDATSGHSVTRRLFGAIMKRGDRYKFLSYANDF